MTDDQGSAPVKPCYLNILENEQPLNSAVQKDSLITVDASKQLNALPLPLPEIETLVPKVKEVKSAQETPESSLAGSPDTESPVLVNDYVCIISISAFYFCAYFFVFRLTFLACKHNSALCLGLETVGIFLFLIQTYFKFEQKGDCNLKQPCQNLKAILFYNFENQRDDFLVAVLREFKFRSEAIM